MDLSVYKFSSVTATVLGQVTTTAKQKSQQHSFILHCPSCGYTILARPSIYTADITSSQVLGHCFLKSFSHNSNKLKTAKNYLYDKLQALKTRLPTSFFFPVLDNYRISTAYLTDKLAFQEYCYVVHQVINRQSHCLRTLKFSSFYSFSVSSSHLTILLVTCCHILHLRNWKIRI